MLRVAFYIFYLLTSIVVLNLFIGIVTDVYPTARSQSYKDWEDSMTKKMRRSMYGIPFPWRVVVVKIAEYPHFALGMCREERFKSTFSISVWERMFGSQHQSSGEHVKPLRKTSSASDALPLWTQSASNPGSGGCIRRLLSCCARDRKSVSNNKRKHVNF